MTALTVNDLPETYHDCRRLVAGRLRGDGAPVPPRALKPRRVDERVLQCAWFDRMFADEGLATATGRPLVIVDPGRWNHEQGPDFLGASLVIDGQPRKGDVEVHADARDWKRHEHHRDFEYNRVILHAVLEAPDGAVRDPKHNGEQAERFVMRPFLRPDLESIQRAVNPDDYPFDEGGGRGKCAAIIAEMSDAFLERYFDLAARERLEAKVRRFADQAADESPEQVFYQGLLTAMGHKGGKALFFLLSKRAPLAEVADFAQQAPPAERVVRIESILLHVASLVPPAGSREGFDDETRAYLDRLEAQWAPAAPYFNDRIIPPTKRWFTGIRPVNFPPRRIAGVAALVAGAASPGRLFSDLVELFRTTAPRAPTRKTAREFVQRFCGAVMIDPGGYWSRRYSFAAKKAARAMTLIGEDQAQSILLNAFVPQAIVRARATGDADLEGRAFALYHRFPRLAENAVTKFMRWRLFADEGRAKQLLTTEARQQALFYLFNDCCNNAAKTCDQCAYLRDEGMA